MNRLRHSFHRGPSLFRITRRLSSSSSAVQSWLSVPGNPLVTWPTTSSATTSLATTSPTLNPNSDPNPLSSPVSFRAIIDLLTDPSLVPGAALESALDRTGIEPECSLLLSVCNHFDSSPKLLKALLFWAEKKKPGILSSAELFNATITALAKLRDFESAWRLIIDRLDGEKGSDVVSVDTFALMIRRYTRAGMTGPAIRTFEFAGTLDTILDSDLQMSLFEILLDSLCKEGHVRIASEYLYHKKDMDTMWIPSIRVYNILLNGWFRARKLKHAEKLWKGMKKENVKPTVVTYGTLVEGYCRMQRPEIAMSLINEMRMEGIEPNAIVFNPIVDALGEAGRFKELWGMMERFLMCESGPTLSTYNSMVKGFCKAEDPSSASRVLKMMISRGFLPTATTYNYFFRYFSKVVKVEEGMNLYTKMIESGYNPDRLTYHLLLKMLCEDDRLDLAMQVSREMKARGFDMDLATSTMLVHLLCKLHRFEEALLEFEDMLRRGIVPQYLTFQRMNNELTRNGMAEMAKKLCKMMSSVPHSTKLPNTYGGDDGSRARRTSIIRKAEAMSDVLKICSDPRKLVKLRGSIENSVSRANKLVDELMKRGDKIQTSS